MFKQSWLLRYSRLAMVVLVAIAAHATPVLAGEGDGDWPERLVLGIVPFREADRMITNLEPLSLMLEERIGIPVAAYISTSFTGLIEAMGSGRVDVGIFGPFALVLAEQRHNTQIILQTVRGEQDYYLAQFAVRADSGIEAVEDLRGRIVAFVDPASTSGFLFPYVFLKDRGIDPETDLTAYIMAGSHDAALLALYHGEVDAAVTFDDAQEVLRPEYPDIMQVVRVLTYTDPIPNDGVAVRKDLDANLTRLLQHALIDIGETKAGSEMLQEMYRADGFTRTDPARYDVVRRTFEVMREYITLH